MNKTKTKLLASVLTSALLLSGCSSESGSGGEYGGIKTINSPAGFTGNIGDVSIESGDTYAVITIKSFGSVTCKLFPEAAPEGVQNFIDLANSGYYSGKEIHRVMEGFMFQGGSRNGDGRSTDDDPSFNVEYNTDMRHFYGALCYANGGGINGSQFYIVNNKSYSAVSTDTLKSNIDYYENQLDMVKEYIANATDPDEKEYYESYKSYFESTVATAKSQLRALNEVTDEITAKYKEVGGTPFLDGGYTVFGQAVDGFDVIDAVSAVEVEPNDSGELSHPVQKVVIESVEIFIAE